MTHVETSSGFIADIDEECLDDMELADLLVEMMNGKQIIVGSVIEKILGSEEKAKLYDHLRNEKGRVPSSACSQAVNEIISQLKAKK